MFSLDLNVDTSGDSTNVGDLFQSSVTLRKKFNLQRFRWPNCLIPIASSDGGTK